MMLRGMAVAGALVAVAVLNMEMTGGEAAVPTDGAAKPGVLAPRSLTDAVPGADGSIALAPLSIGNPTAAAAIDRLDADRPSAIALTSPEGANVARSLAALAKGEPETYKKIMIVKSGDTLGNMLRRVGVEAADAEQSIDALRAIYDPRRLRPGNKVSVSFVRDGSDVGVDSFTGFEIPLNYASRVHVSPSPKGGFDAEEIQIDLTTRMVRAEGAIDASLFQAGADAGVPASVMAELVRAFSWDVDFQRDIRKDDRFELMYERSFDPKGKPVHNGKIVFAALTLSGQHTPIFLHTTADGRVGFFNDKGQGAKKALLRTPIDGARLSSHFGMRKHPILGYTKAHTGTDFAAPPGTPIYAAGDGVIDFSGWKGGYGKYIRIRHNSEYSTAYAHMKGFARSMSQGKRVHQGQVIGYVGTTGRSTGPHLHFEILRAGKHVNPMKVKMPSGEKLAGKELARFERTRDALKQQWASLAPPQRVAQR
ncbi:MAG: peptidoglycan DD-metalloendopeptidase family protein [Alphaproteobacteria bacterium]|nr:peptidoglycan DD-metalloendopeptidase family protein [Alphaproteobacteria bacterium]MBF0251089.1 peptidoglycan DD-metalloendopeptidase family protein [Alphaproteobacteria bacterium]